MQLFNRPYLFSLAQTDDIKKQLPGKIREAVYHECRGNPYIGFPHIPVISGTGTTAFELFLGLLPPDLKQRIGVT